MNLIKFLKCMEGGVGGMPVKFGAQRGLVDVCVDLPMAASEVLVDKSGRFVNIDSNGNGVVSGSTSATIFGFVETFAQTCSSTAAATVVPCVVDTETIFRIPVNQAVTCGATKALWKAIIGKKLDLRVDSTIQGLDADVGTNVNLIVVGQDEWKAAWSSIAQSKIDQSCRWVDVKINAAIQGK
jgi:hypothetical protein